MITKRNLKVNSKEVVVEDKTKRAKEDQEILKKQVELELEGVQRGINKYENIKKEAEKNGVVSTLPSGYLLMNKAIEPLVLALEEFKGSRQYGKWANATKKFLLPLDSLETAYIIAKVMINSIAEINSIQTPALRIYRALYHHLNYLRFKDKMPKYVKAIERGLIKRDSSQEAYASIMKKMAKRKGDPVELPDKRTQFQIGIKLVELFIEHTGLVERVREEGDQSGYIVRATEETLEWLETQDEVVQLLHPVNLPMIVPPRDWTNLYDGGYITNQENYRIKLVKTRNKEATEALEDHEMPEVYQAVNNLQKTPWRINEKMLEIINEAKKFQEGIGGLPRPEDEPLPVKPWKEKGIPYEDFKELYPDQVDTYRIETEATYQRIASTRGKRVSLALQLNMAKDFTQYDSMYFVYTLDWRGRIYPLQSYLNPQGNDTAKALLEFAEGKPLGEDGAYWLAVQLANKFGVDKVSFDERVEWVYENEQWILDSAYNPLNGERFWCDADAPLQFLSACLEWKGYREEGEAFVSHLPIAMDGTCNGLQNFSAMLLDQRGGEATNLVPADKPQDIYMEVVEVVRKLIKKDALDDSLPQKDRDHALLWIGKVDRKMAKRPVMTKPYGVTMRGMRDQIINEVAERDNALGRGVGAYLDTEPKDIWGACYYLAKKMEEAIDEVVVASKYAMEYLQKVARSVAKEEKPLYWTTPAGFLVYQKYLSQKGLRINTYWGKDKLIVKLGLRVDTDKLDKRKQATGISPNFVHSMDASHLMKTINTCVKREGISNFAMIHDSYGTHASDTTKLGEVLREEFVKQYSGDVIARFDKEVREQTQGVELKDYPELPSRGSLDISRVLESKYFFA